MYISFVQKPCTIACFIENGDKESLYSVTVLSLSFEMTVDKVQPITEYASATDKTPFPVEVVMTGYKIRAHKAYSIGTRGFLPGA